MTLHVGTRIWIPCRVKPGPFSDERTVLVSSDDSDWSGFVNVRWLKSRGDNDNDQVLATVVSIDGTTVTTTRAPTATASAPSRTRSNG